MSVQGDLKSLPTGMREQIESSEALHVWDVSALQYGARALAANENNVFMFGITHGTTFVAPWSDVEELSFPTQFLVNLKFRGQDSRLMTLKQMGQRREIAAAVPASHRTRLGLDEQPIAHTPDSVVRSTGSPGARAASQGDPVAALWRFFWIGVGLQVLAGVFIASSWPTASYDFDQGDIVEEGSAGGLVFGWLLGGAGTLVMFVALIGFGTMLGIRAARTRG